MGFVSTVALARWLGPSGRGLLALMTYATELVVAGAAFGFTYAVVYFVSRRDPPRGAILGNSLLLSGVLAVVFIPGFALLSGPIAHLLSHGRGAGDWWLVGPVVVITFLDWCIHNQLLGKLLFGRLNVLLVVSRLATVAGIVLFVGVAGWGVDGGLLSSMAASIVIIAGTLYAIRDVRPTVDLKLMREMFVYGARVSVGWIFQLANYRADVFVLQAYVPLAAVGEYVVAVLVAELALTFGGALGTSVTTLVARYEGEEAQPRTIADSMRHGVILTGAVIVVLAVVGKFLIELAFGHAYLPAVTPMYILLPGMMFVGLGGVVTANLRGIGRPGRSSIIAGVTVVITLALDFILIPRYGVNGAAAASDVAYAVFGCLGVAMLSRLTGISVRALTVPTSGDMQAYWRATKIVVGAVARPRVWLAAQQAAKPPLDGPETPSPGA